jgi:beta-galactosidase
MSRINLVGLLGLLLTFAAGCLTVQAGEYAWIEAEQPVTTPTIAPPENNPRDAGYEMKGWGNLEFLSGSKVLSLNIPEGQGEKRLGKDGAVFGYEFEAKSAGKHQVWARIGFEWVRSDFDWRIDAAEWKTCKSTDPTCDLMPIAFWCEVAWIQLGEVDLAAGKHKLEIRHLPQTRQDKGKTIPARNLHFTDCFCICNGTFRPNGRFQPGQDFAGDDGPKAAAQTFELKAAATPGERAAVALTGLWQIARWDENAVKEEDRLKGPEALPKLDELYWYPIAVPSDRNKPRPDFEFSHRNVYRTRVQVPTELKGRSFVLDFQNFSMIASVFVNGAPCGWSKDFYARWQCDVTKGIKPGVVNEICVVIKDRYYATRPPEGNPLGVRHNFNLPGDMLRNQGVTMGLDMPMFGNELTGIFEPLTLVATGATYVEDVFAKPSLKKKELALDVTLRNPGAAETKVALQTEIVPWNGGKGGAAEKTFAAKEIAVPAGQTANVALAEKWENPKLWWPDDPQLYEAVTKVLLNGQVVDVLHTRFGFREWEWDSHVFKLNGVKWWLWAHCDYGRSPDELQKEMARTGMNMIRLWGMPWGQPRVQSLKWCDERGIVVRSSGVFDGEMASYGLSRDRKPNRALFDNWISQLKAWVKTERNHPSVMIWSVENEIAYINSLNLGQADIAEPEIRRGAEAVEQLDPTRPTMVDGGRCLKSKTMPVNGCHYNDQCLKTWRDFPDAAYTAREDWYANIERGAWEMVKDRPIFHGECFYANGWAPQEYSAIDGDRCFLGIAEARHAKGLYGKMLSEGWRWCETSAFHFWTGIEDGTWISAWQPVAVFCRQWNWTFNGRSTVTRTLKVFNSTRYAEPIEAAWELRVGGQRVAGEAKNFNLAAGENGEPYDVSLAVPAVKERTEGEFILTCTRGGKDVFREVKAVSILPADAGPKPSLAQNELVVVDPQGSVKERLKKRGIAFTEAADVNALPENAKVVVLGKDAVPETKSTDSVWHSLALKGVRLLVLEQQNPLHYQALPADLDVTNFAGRIAFPEDLGHAAFVGLAQKDFFTWSGDHVVYRNAYKKGTKGGRSLVQCDNLLNYSALAECQPGEGLMLLCQMAVGEKLAADPVAQRLFDNLLAYAASYKPVRKATAVAVNVETPKGKLVKSLGLKHDAVADPLAALDPKYGIAVIDATPENLKKVAAAADRVKAFTDAGGWLMLWGVTPEGLADYNRIVGVEHIIRPFQMERVTLAVPADSLTSGLTLRDVVMDNGKDIFGWMSLKFPAEDEFTSILDYDEVGPFLKFPTPAELGKPADVAHPGWDHWPQNMVNNYTADDTWRFCYSIALDRGDKTKWTMELPRPEVLTNFGIVLNVIYHKVTKINLYFDDDPQPVVMETRPTHDRQDFAIPDRKAQRVTIELAEWEKSGTANVIGIDNFWISVKRSPEFYKNVRPLLNIGGLLRYNRGAGGILTNQLNILEREQNPVNVEKKANITKTLLRNLGAVFEGGQGVVVGTNLKFTPIRFAEGKANAYTRKAGKPSWFKNHPVGDLSGLPAGENAFAGVTYAVPDFRTSPVPSCVMLQGHWSETKDREVKDLKVGTKADALFFLHAFTAKDEALRWKPERNRTNPPVVFKYVIHYADGKIAEVPVTWNQGVGHWLNKKPKSLMYAQVGWAAGFENDKSGDQAVVYSMQWDNPRPEVEIQSVDLVYGAEGDKWGAPALLAITAVEAKR